MCEQYLVLSVNSLYMLFTGAELCSKSYCIRLSECGSHPNQMKSLPHPTPYYCLDVLKDTLDEEHSSVTVNKESSPLHSPPEAPPRTITELTVASDPVTAPVEHQVLF